MQYCISMPTLLVGHSHAPRHCSILIVISATFCTESGIYRVCCRYCWIYITVRPLRCQQFYTLAAFTGFGLCPAFTFFFMRPPGH